MQKPWRIRIGRAARVFAPKPSNIFQHAVLLYRGYRPFNHIWGSKPNQTVKEQARKDGMEFWA